MVVYVSSIVVLLFQGWGWIENDNPIVSDGSVMISYGSLSFQGWGMAVELAASIVENP